MLTKMANDAEEYADAAEDVKSNCDDLALLLNTIDATVKDALIQNRDVKNNRANREAIEEM